MPATADVAKSNYLGSKRRLAKYIAGKFPADGKSIADPMCGISAVLVEAAKRGYTVRGNDLSIVPYWYSKGIFEGAQLSDDDVEKLAGATPVSGWLTTEWNGMYPRPKEVRRFLDGLAAAAREWKGPKGWAAKAVASAMLQTVYSESGSGYSTLRYESVAKIAETVKRAAREVNGLIADVSGKGEITNQDARAFGFPKSDVAYFDPPYFKRDKGAVQYFQSYKIPNSILLGREWKADNLRPEEIPALVERLCKSARHVYVSTSSNEVVPYAKELSRHKKTMKRFRVSYRQTSGFGSRDAEQHQHLYVAKAEPPEGAAPVATAAPDEDGAYRYAIQEHFRGRSVHSDLRMETGGPKLEAWTLNTQVAGSVPEPVATVEMARDAEGHSKVDWEAGELHEPVSALPKPPCDPSWLTFEGVIEPGEMGALDDGPGVIRIVDRGVCEYGARRPDMREYFLTSDAVAGGVAGRVVFSRLQDSPDGLWLFALPEDDTPYVLSRGAVASGWVPPKDVSALPGGLREEIPEDRRFWTLDDEAERRSARDALVTALMDGELELSCIAKSEAGVEFEKRKLAPFNQWGSSTKYAKRLVERLPEHKRYAEPFCGAASMLFAKQRSEEEILADVDPETIFALKYIQRLTPQKFEALKQHTWKVSRTGWKRARECKPSSDSERFWKFVYDRFCSWGGISNASGFSTINDGKTYDLEELWRFHERLKGAMIVRQDWKETLRKADSADTLFFIDPPYIEEWIRGGGITPEEIAEGVAKLKGKFVVAYTDSARARRALAKVGKLFTMKLLEARNRGLWAKRSRLFAASFDVKKSKDDADLAELCKADEPTFPVTFECTLDIAKAYEDDGRWIVEGYAATSDFDLQDDIISEQAIRDSAKDLLENSTVLHNHNPDEAIGRVLDSKAGAEGLFLKIMISKTASEKWQQIKEGVLNKFSVRGKVLEAGKQWMPELKRHARVIQRMQLVEVSLVAVPANPKARAIRWYVEKALDEFEKAGGLLESGAEGTSGGCHVNDEKSTAEGDVQEELIEAKGEGGQAAPASDPKDAEKVGEGDAAALISKLLADEKDPARRATLERILAAVSSPPSTEKGPAPADEVAKAGRKMSGARIERLKRLLEELKGLIVEVDNSDAAKDVSKDATPPAASAASDAILERIARALGIEPSKPGEVPNIAEAVEGLKKRLDSLEATPAGKTSLDEGDDAAGKEKDTVWKGLL